MIERDIREMEIELREIQTEDDQKYWEELEERIINHQVFDIDL